MRIRIIASRVDFLLIGAVLLLSGIGLAMLASAADTGATISPLLYRQAIALLVGGVAMVFIVQVPYHKLKPIAPFLFVAGVAVQLILSVVGRTIRGTVSRLDVFGFQIQPSEFIKIILVLVLAFALAKYKHIGVRALVVTGALIALPVLLVLREPDFGMATLMIGLWVGLLIVFGLSWRLTGVLALLGAIIFAGAWQVVLLDYQKERILTFLNPTADPLRSGYNVTQSMIALGSGEILGRGLGHGPQSQLKFLPERHTDFILASVGEELGFVGIALVVILYSILLARLIGIVRSTRDPFGQLIASGVFFIFIIGFVVNAGMNIGILPVTGIPLPLVSYGGSNLLASCILLGLALSVKMHSTFSRYAPSELSSFI
ncbi:MAG TPA: rod shape-determining protein RodA [Candidatus Andersenbacteria bacterium]|nr:rod shape-determining protein RodA [Candidatus Andersenbacteria bacterium]